MKKPGQARARKRRPHRRQSRRLLPRPRPIPPVTPLEASHLRIYQVLPDFPTSLSIRGKTYRVATRICINTAGRVERVEVEQVNDAEIDALVVGAERKWRYRPRIVRGEPRPFCHPMIITFEVQ